METLSIKEPKILHLTLKKKWFDMILSGEKKEEYRDIKDYWEKRFLLDYDHIHKKWNERKLPAFKGYDVIVFKNGYSKDAPSIEVEFDGFSIGKGKNEWGAIGENKYFILHLGKVLNTIKETKKLKCDCCNGTGYVEGDFRDELEGCLTCNGRGSF